LSDSTRGKITKRVKALFCIVISNKEKYTSGNLGSDSVFPGALETSVKRIFIKDYYK